MAGGRASSAKLNGEQEACLAKSQTPADKPAKTEAAGKVKRPLSENFIRVWAPTLVTALFIITFNVQAFEIPSGSMENTLLIGDHVLVDRVRFSPPSTYLHGLEPYRPPQRGDIIVFMSMTQPGLHLVKRLMGLPGDHLKVVHKVLYRNGVALNEPYAVHDREYDPGPDDWPNGFLPNETPEWAASKQQFLQNGEIVVPPGHYFMMGDNRDESYDSRFWGFVPQDHIIGRPVLIYWSYKSDESDYAATDMADRLKGLISVLIHFPVRTRWNRTFKIVH